MNRHVTGIAVAVGLLLMTGVAGAKGPSAPYPVELQGHVRSVNRQQQIIVLDDGTNLAATSPQQLDMVQPGNAVKVLFVEDAGIKRIERIVVTK